MKSADARRFIDKHELGEHVAKFTADAPPVSDAQLESLHAIFQSPNHKSAEARNEKKVS
jgi:hypothetical protein